MNEMKSIVITGSTSGIGLGLAGSFLDLGCQVVISGRSPERLKAAADKLAEKFDTERTACFLCDVRNREEVRSLWDFAVRTFGKVDIWINNAGIAHPDTAIADFTEEQVKEVTDTNIAGTINGCIVALRGTRQQGSGAIYNLEGLGSDGRIISGLALYGLSKSAVTYFTSALAKETKGTPVIAGGIKPMMVATKLITAQYEGHPEEWDRVKGTLNLLSDRVETVTPWIARRVLQNKKNGAHISWLTGRKVITRMLLAPFVKRKVFDM